ncbi:MAG: 1-acyl-sn-glycerol-3-phosphate acyltransferase [Maricaulaceae bacterium]|nr:1-acyl-sn-glycerol-3-phosphate acyltransferase [Maricaulaceae bacterium]
MSVLLPVDRDNSAYVRRPPEMSGREVVDILLSERAKGMDRSWWWPLARPVLNAALGYEKACELADAFAPLSGQQAMQLARDYMALDVQAYGEDRIPHDGPLLIVANHPGGIPDGVALDAVVRPKRGDLVYFANADALRVAPRFDEVLIPVEWRREKRSRAKSRETLKLALSAIRDERALAVFPAGRIGQKGRDGRIIDPPWEESAAILSRRHGAPILPVNFQSRCSDLFYFFSRFSEPLRDMTLFYEMIEKRGKPYRLAFGPLIDPAQMDGDPGAVTARLKTYIEDELAEDPDREFRP